MNPLERRLSGILLHPTSLPGPHGCGDFGPAAFHFIDWLAAAGQSLWQVLPLGGIGPGDSPYMSPSAFGGNPLLVSLERLADEGWLSADEVRPVEGLRADRVDYAAVHAFRMDRLARAARRFAADADPAARSARAAFERAAAHWLDDYALFMAAHDSLGGPWCDWPAALARRERTALAELRDTQAQRVDFWRFVQWCFHRQWQAVREHAHRSGIAVMGDVPIFIAHHSAEVWSRPELFELDAQGRQTVVAGVPPDAFSETGQRWGNPLYRWSAHADEGYDWWTRRLRHALEQADAVRIDHFRGFAAHWEVPAASPTALQGRWQPGPGIALFDALQAALAPAGASLPLLAEDLGVITPDVEALRHQARLPGMRILQFAFGGDASNPYLPHRHTADSVVYTGTHDNDTNSGWWAQARAAERQHLLRYLGCSADDAPAALLRAALASVARTAILPMQDVLGLGSDARMNFPGEASGWWRWRLQWESVQPVHAQGLREMTALYGRLGP